MLMMAIPGVEILAVHFTLFLMYSTDDINVCGSRGDEFEAIGSV